MNESKYRTTVRGSFNPELSYERRLDNWGLGLTGEAGEIFTVLDSPMVQNLYYQGNTTEATKKNLLEELGDWRWYFTALYSDLNIPFNEGIVSGASRDPFALSGRLMVESCKLADLIKKVTCHGHPLDKHITEFVMLLNNCLRYYLTLLRCFDFFDEGVKNANIAKLSARYSNCKFSTKQSIARVDTVDSSIISEDERIELKMLREKLRQYGPGSQSPPAKDLMREFDLIEKEQFTQKMIQEGKYCPDNVPGCNIKHAVIPCPDYEPTPAEEDAHYRAMEQKLVYEGKLPFIQTLRKDSFQAREFEWVLAMAGEERTNDVTIRNHRFFEEATELVQACGLRKEQAHKLVDYVYSRPQGDPVQEVGGTMTTLASLCTVHEINMVKAAEDELADMWKNIDRIRIKHFAKPLFKNEFYEDHPIANLIDWSKVELQEIEKNPEEVPESKTYSLSESIGSRTQW